MNMSNNITNIKLGPGIKQNSTNKPFLFKLISLGFLAYNSFFSGPRVSTKTFIDEPTSNHTATIIFLHGLGDTGEGWSKELSHVKPSYVKLICPTAEENPVTLNLHRRTHSWYDIRSMNENDTNEDIQGIKSASQKIIQLIQNEINGVNGKPGIPPSRIILGGFSQGGALALYTGLTGSIPIGGIISMSGYLPGRNTIDWSSIQKPSIFQGHGDIDKLIPFKLGLMTFNTLETHLSTNITFKIYKGLGHSTSKEELKDVKDYIYECIPPILSH